MALHDDPIQERLSGKCTTAHSRTTGLPSEQHHHHHHRHPHTHKALCKKVVKSIFITLFPLACVCAHVLPTASGRRKQNRTPFTQKAQSLRARAILQSTKRILSPQTNALLHQKRHWYIRGSRWPPTNPLSLPRGLFIPWAPALNPSVTNRANLVRAHHQLSRGQNWLSSLWCNTAAQRALS